MEKPLQVFCFDSHTGVLDVNYQLLIYVVKARFDGDLTTGSEFERVFDQVDQNLSETNFVAVQIWQFCLHAR